MMLKIKQQKADCLLCLQILIQRAQTNILIISSNVPENN